MVRVRVICGYDVILNMSTAVRIKLQTVVWKFSPTYFSTLQNIVHLVIVSAVLVITKAKIL